MMGTRGDGTGFWEEGEGDEGGGRNKMEGVRKYGEDNIEMGIRERQKVKIKSKGREEINFCE